MNHEDTLAKRSEVQDTKEEKIIPLLEEKLFVDNHKQKVGEVIVRKEIETQMIEVPVRREKLIVEQISPEHQQLAEIDLSHGEIPGLELINEEISTVPSVARGLTVSGEFISPKIASLLLNAIAQEKNHGCQQVQITILVENQSQQQKYQEWFDRCSHTSSISPTSPTSHIYSREQGTGNREQV